MSEEYQKITIPEYVEYQSLKKKLDCAVKALEFYADKDSWEGRDGHKTATVIKIISEADVDERDNLLTKVYGGKRARLALEEIKNGK